MSPSLQKKKVSARDRILQKHENILTLLQKAEESMGGIRVNKLSDFNKNLLEAQKCLGDLIDEIQLEKDKGFGTRLLVSYSYLRHRLIDANMTKELGSIYEARTFLNSINQSLKNDTVEGRA